MKNEEESTLLDDAMGLAPTSPSLPRTLITVTHSLATDPTPVWTHFTSRARGGCVLVAAGTRLADSHAAAARFSGNPLGSEHPFLWIAVPPIPSPWLPRAASRVGELSSRKNSEGNRPIGGSDAWKNSDGGAAGPSAGPIDAALVGPLAEPRCSAAVALPCPIGAFSGGAGAGSDMLDVSRSPVRAEAMASLAAAIAGAVGECGDRAVDGSGDTVVVVFDTLEPFTDSLGHDAVVDFLTRLQSDLDVCVVVCLSHDIVDNESSGLIDDLASLSSHVVQVRPLETGHSDLFDGLVSVSNWNLPGTRTHVLSSEKDAHRRLLFATKKGSPTRFFVPGTAG